MDRSAGAGSYTARQERTTDEAGGGTTVGRNTTEEVGLSEVERA